MVRLGFRQAVGRRCGVVVDLSSAWVRDTLSAIQDTASRLESGILETAVSERPPRRVKLIIITACFDGDHAAESKHYHDQAIDFSLETFRREAIEPFCEALRARLGPQHTVLLESFGRYNEHGHVQVRAGLHATAATPTTEEPL